MKRRFIVLTGFLLVLAPFATGNGGDEERGTGVLTCEASIVGWRNYCGPPGGNQPFTFRNSAKANNVSLTVRWDPLSADAEVLRVRIFGSRTCEDENGEEPSCFQQIIEGSSPVTVRLGGRGATGLIDGYVNVPATCDYYEEPLEACSIPPVRLVRDQPYEYVWRTS